MTLSTIYMVIMVLFKGVSVFSIYSVCNIAGMCVLQVALGRSPGWIWPQPTGDEACRQRIGGWTATSPCH